jgi:hypothetical protein
VQAAPAEQSPFRLSFIRTHGASHALQAAMAAGFKFFLSSNQVLLCEGPLPAQYVSQVQLSDLPDEWQAQRQQGGKGGGGRGGGQKRGPGSSRNSQEGGEQQRRPAPPAAAPAMEPGTTAASVAGSAGPREAGLDT